MASFILPVSTPWRIWTAVVCLALATCVQAPVAAAQHGGHAGGGHFGGGGHLGGGHFSSGAVASPRVSPPRSGPSPISRPRFSTIAPARWGAVSTSGISFRRRPIHPRPISPIFPVPVFWGGPFFGLGWPGCDPWWGWGLGCQFYPNYGYGFGYWPYFGGLYYGGYTSPPTYETPSYQYGGYGTGERQLPELCLKDGTVYKVTDYWLVEGRLHFTMPDVTGTKSVEHVIGFDELDLQETIDVNTRRGFRFVLRNEPLQQYLEHHPDAEPPTEEPLIDK